MTHATTPTADGFAAFGLHEKLLQAVDAMGFTEPTPIQQQAIGAVLEGRDVLGLAQTGTGKTAAFGLPLLHRLWTGEGRGTRALILAPTRELATQIDVELRMLAKFSPLKTVTIYGGVSANPQIQALRRKPDIIVACPGRLLDLYGQNKVVLRYIETLVLDEADHMFDMGFLPDIRRIMAELPAQRQNLLFSATMPSDIRHLADETLRDPVTVEVDFKGPAKTVRHGIFPLDDKTKTPLLKHLLKRDDVTSAIVFTRTKHRARRLADQLKRGGIEATALQGNMSQNQRDRAMRDFRNGKVKFLIATDIVARGIDVASVSHVINYDMPNTAEAYTHRIGRTGRAEATGEAFTFATSDDRKMVRDIERKLGKPIQRLEADGFTAAIDFGAPGGATGGSSGGSRGGGNRSGNRGPAGRGGNRGGGGGGGQRRGNRGRNGARGQRSSGGGNASRRGA